MKDVFKVPSKTPDGDEGAVERDPFLFLRHPPVTHTRGRVMRVGGEVQLLLRGERGWGTFCRKNKDLMAVVEYEDGVET